MASIQTALPPTLARPLVVDGVVAGRLVLGVTAYLVGPTVAEFDALWSVYRRLCPPARRTLFKIDEFLTWSAFAQPHLTASAREAAAKAVQAPYFQATRNRVADGRDFLLTVWDDHEIGHPDGSWSYTCGQARTEDGEQQAFVRVLLPLEHDLDTLLEVARGIADSAEFSSGHAGLVYVFDPDFAADAFDAFYALAKRYWGIDVADLDATLAVVAERIKGVDWLTLVGTDLLSSVADGLGTLARDADIDVERRAHGVLIRAGTEPQPGDQNRKPASPETYRRVAHALAPLFPDEFPDLGGEKFIDTGDTLAWVRRFLDPAGW